MRVLTEIIGGALLLIVFFFGMKTVIKQFATMEKPSDVHDNGPDAAPTADKPD